jgi:hypothetical protein
MRLPPLSLSARDFIILRFLFPGLSKPHSWSAAVLIDERAPADSQAKPNRPRIAARSDRTGMNATLRSGSCCISYKTSSNYSPTIPRSAGPGAYRAPANLSFQGHPISSPIGSSALQSRSYASIMGRDAGLTVFDQPPCQRGTGQVDLPNYRRKSMPRNYSDRFQLVRETLIVGVWGLA